jgi:hypothetical protein
MPHPVARDASEARCATRALGVSLVLSAFKLSSRFGFLRSAGSGGATGAEAGKPQLSGIAKRASVDQIAQAVRSALTGCDLHEDQATAVLRRIDSAITPQALWQLRPELYQIIARTFSQSEAQRRVNELLPLFEGWVPAHQLNAI